jgi:DNA primase catalytic subunit
MAINRLRENRKTSEQIDQLRKGAAVKHAHLNDQWVYKLGTSRRSEIYARITSKNVPYKQAVDEYLDSL